MAMGNTNKHFKNIKLLHIFFLAAGILIVYKIFFDYSSVLAWKDQLMGVMGPFLAGFIIAYCINIPCSWLESKLAKVKVKWIHTIARPASIIFVYLAFILLVIFAVGKFIPMVYENVSQFVVLLPYYFDQLLVFLQNLPSVGILEFDVWIDSLVEAKPWNSLLSSFDAASLLNSIQYVTSFFFSLFKIVLALISSIYFLLEYDKIKAFVRRIVGLISSEKRRLSANKYIRLVDLSFRKYLICQILDSLILGTITTIEFLILKSPYAVALGTLLAVANIVPYFGSIIGSIIVVIIMAFTNGIETAVVTAVILLITQQTDANFIQPKLMGTSFSISPILIIIGISIGGSLGGIVGMIFAIPVVNVLKTVLEEYMNTRENMKE